jgi:multicomponent Na+:H+ antiporter subunit D
MTATDAEVLLPLLVAVPLLVGGLVAAARGTSLVARSLLIGTLAALVVAAAVLVVLTADGEVLGHGVGGWPAGIAIPFVADTFTALMLLGTSVVTLVCVVFATGGGVGARPLFPALVLVLIAGVNGALLTADLFNLFVFVEVMLLPSYGLLVLARRGRGTDDSVVGSRIYVTVNLFVSTVFLAGVALVYGTAGTVNLAELAGAGRESGWTAAALGICLFALSMKAGAMPAYGWLTRSYPTTAPAVTAMFSALHTKVAIYAIYRVYAVAFDGDSRYLWIILAIVSVTMVLGVLGAVGAGSMRAILAFNMVRGTGFILLGVALFGVAGLSAGMYYLMHHMVVTASLFLAVGAVELRYGTGRLGSVTGVARREPLLAATFAIGALSLAGLPPFSGFVAKLGIVLAAIDAGAIAAIVVVLVVSLLTLLSVVRIWNGVFAPDSEPPGEPPTEDPAAPAGAGSGVLTAAPAQAPAVPRIGARLTTPALVLALLSLAMGVGAEGLLALTTVAAEGLVDPSAYVEAVLR